MARLSVSLLGPFHVTLDEKPVTGFESHKVRALLAYLAVESRVPHPRETLAGLLWPNRPERTARRNLSQALSNLRRCIRDRDATPSFLAITHHTLSVERVSDLWVDATAFEELLDACKTHPHPALEGCDICMDRLRRAQELYRGDLLEGFSLPGSPAFEEWALLKREQLRHRATKALETLSACHHRRGEYGTALRYAQRWIELDPWHEGAHRHAMRALALTGQRNAALA